MAQVNLLPWREKRRLQLKVQFFAVLGVCVVLGFSSVSLGNMFVQKKIAVQDEKNNLIRSEQSALEQDIETINKLEKQRAELTERLRVIQELQGRRSVIVHQLDEFARLVPEGVYFTKLSKKEGVFSIEGISDTNHRISDLIRNFSQSIWFKNPVLSEVSAQGADDQKSGGNKFSLTVLENIPDEAQVRADAQKAQPE